MIDQKIFILERLASILIMIIWGIGMLMKERTASFFIIVFLIVTQAFSMNAEENFVPSLTSQGEIRLDFSIQEKDNSIWQKGREASVQEPKAAMKTTIGKTQMINFLQNKRKPYTDMHSKRPGTAIITIMSQITGYRVYVDGSLIDTEGQTEPPDGQITIRIDGDLSHTIEIVQGTYSNRITKYFEMEKAYTISL